MEPSDLVETGQARRLAEARERSGREIGELASLLGISYEAYWDLESFDEEVVDCISLGQMKTLAAALGLDLRDFFAARDVGQLTLTDFAARLEGLLDGRPESLDALEEEVGWEFARHLEDPETFAELPAIALADIGTAVDVDWRSLLPQSP